MLFSVVFLDRLVSAAMVEYPHTKADLEQMALATLAPVENTGALMEATPKSTGFLLHRTVKYNILLISPRGGYEEVFAMTIIQSHTETKKIIHRLSRAIGHLESIRTMVEEERDCSEVLIQIAAVKSAVNSIGKLILQDHIEHCVMDAVTTGDSQVLQDLSKTIDQFIK